LGQGSFAHGPIHALPIPGDACHRVEFSQSGPPKRHEQSGFMPILKMLVKDADTRERLQQHPQFR
jgi:hypothetical protein